MLAVLAASDPEKVDAALKQSYPNEFFLVHPGEWIVSSDNTAQQVSDALGITDGTNGSAIVISFFSYYGRSNPQTWEWIANKMGALKRA